MKQEGKEFRPVNGQLLCPYGEMPFGLWRVGRNGCALLAVYNALGLLGCPLSMEQIRDAFTRWYRPRLFGVFPGELRRFFRRRGLQVERMPHEGALQQRLQQGGVGILTYWNCKFSLFGLRLPKFWKGAHTVAVCRGADGRYVVYNPLANRKAALGCHSLSVLFGPSLWLSGCHLSPPERESASSEGC